MVLLPIFMTFLIMHAVLIGGSLVFNVSKIGETAVHVSEGVSSGLADPSFGLLAMLMVFLVWLFGIVMLIPVLIEPLRDTLRELRQELESHLLKEERILFPMIRELEAADTAPSFHCGSLRNPISVMLSEHDRVGAILASMRRRTDDYTAPADGCATYSACFTALREIEADTHLHVHKENNVLFPLVVRLEMERR